MILHQYYIECLSQASYLIADETSGKAVVVDPRRDIAEYLADAARSDLTIIGVINTHVHADFVAGHLELADAVGAWIGYGPTAAERAEFDVVTLSHGNAIPLGEQVSLEILETPGHTWESISVLVRDGGRPRAVLTGDSLFIGGVGRPDLVVAGASTPDDLARAMHRTLHEVLLPLPDDTAVYPAHGAGSSCGKQLSDALDSTIGAQRRDNLFARPMPEDDFVALVTEGQPPAPAYFVVDAALNLRRRDVLDRSEVVAPVTVAEARRAIDGGVMVVDARPPVEFAAGHLRGSLNVGLEGRFAETVGMVVPAGAEVMLVVEDADHAAEARMRMRRIGFDAVIGYLTAERLAAIPDLVETTQRVPATLVQASPAVLLDVRNAGEREDGQVIPGAVHIPLAELRDRAVDIAEGPVVVHCASGWRSSVAASLLRSLGRDAVDVEGGYAAWAAR